MHIFIGSSSNIIIIIVKTNQSRIKLVSSLQFLGKGGNLFTDLHKILAFFSFEIEEW